MLSYFNHKSVLNKLKSMQDLPKSTVLLIVLTFVLSTGLAYSGPKKKVKSFSQGSFIFLGLKDRITSIIKESTSSVEGYIVNAIKAKGKAAKVSPVVSFLSPAAGQILTSQPLVEVKFSEEVLASTKGRGALNPSNYRLGGAGAKGLKVTKVTGEGAGPYSLSFSGDFVSGVVVVTVRRVASLSGGIAKNTRLKFSMEIPPTDTDNSGLKIVDSLLQPSLFSPKLGKLRLKTNLVGSPIKGKRGDVFRAVQLFLVKSESNEVLKKVVKGKRISLNQMNRSVASSNLTFSINLSWDGLDSKGQSVGNGEYSYQTYVKLLKKQGPRGKFKVVTTSQSVSGFFEVDTESPELLAISPQDGDVLNHTTPTISVSFSENVQGAKLLENYQFSGNGLNDVYLTGVAGLGAGPYTLSLNGDFVEGDVVLEVLNIKDEAGNPMEGEVVTNFSMLIPLVLSASSPNESFNAKTATVSYEFNKAVVDTELDNGSALNIDNVTLSGEGAEGLEVVAVSGNGAGPYVLELDGEFSTGEVKVTLENIEDLFVQAMVSSEIDFVVDATIPDIFLTTPYPNSTVSSNVLISGLVSDGLSGLVESSFKITLDGIEQNGVVISDGEFSLSLPDLAEGNHQLIFEVYDAVGNMEQAGSSFTVDKTNPLLNVTNPDTDGLVFTTGTPTFMGIFSDNAGLDLTSFMIDLNGTDLREETSITEGGFSVVTPDLEEGNYELTVQISDLVGNSSVVTRNLSVDLTVTPPVSGNATGDWSVETIASGVNPQYVKVVDANNDGKNDIVYKEINDGLIKVIYQE